MSYLAGSEKMKFLEVFASRSSPTGEFQGAFPNGETFPLREPTKTSGVIKKKVFAIRHNQCVVFSVVGIKSSSSFGRGFLPSGIPKKRGQPFHP